MRAFSTTSCMCFAPDKSARMHKLCARPLGGELRNILHMALHVCMALVHCQMLHRLCPIMILWTLCCTCMLARIFTLHCVALLHRLRALWSAACHLCRHICARVYSMLYAELSQTIRIQSHNALLAGSLLVHKSCIMISARFGLWATKCSGLPTTQCQLPTPFTSEV